MWDPGDRQSWESPADAERREYLRALIQDNIAMFVTGPKWIFSVDRLAESQHVGYVDADLAGPHTEPGEANIAYSVHPEHRGNGYAARAVALVAQFLREHTGARHAYLQIDPRNTPSMQVAKKVRARRVGHVAPESGPTLTRYVIDLEAAPVL